MIDTLFYHDLLAIVLALIVLIGAAVLIDILMMSMYDDDFQYIDEEVKDENQA